jgi:hypothetical protein
MKFESKRQAFIGLFGNYGQSLSDKQIGVWEAASEPWDLGKITKGVGACIRDQARVFCPQGFGEFARYLPEPGSGPGTKLRHYGSGDFGGDWADASLIGLLVAAIETRVQGYDLPKPIMEICARRGIVSAIDEGYEACKKGGSIDRWARSWEG